ncbi:serine/threonine protein phosphatase [Devosia sp. PTR5]|uniref:Serine/threonine protein phosphatase n=1 Tax=Devosia oryzisoli TaxID=2774138 RepID=A0A927IRJ9_9HYPH|nr:metallophosphoesterase family protein [Devosia oryzisoli]MBD8066780.1 serine/threonine protein phosphatase [Devosia oryzisoli]
MTLRQTLTFWRRPASPLVSARHPTLTWPGAIYAIGDVHGRLDLLEDAQRRIAADAASVPGEKYIVMLGDYVDRGPASAGVLDALVGAPALPFKRICLMGNHEAMMLAGLSQPGAEDLWLANGGDTTLRSYGLDPALLSDNGRRAHLQTVRARIPEEHIEFLQHLPLSLRIEDEVILCHSGVVDRKGIEATDEADLLWARPTAERDADADGPLVIHGHTPVDSPLVTPRRINIDTGACMTGLLTVVRLVRGQPAFILPQTSLQN